MSQSTLNHALAAFNAGQFDVASQILRTHLSKTPNDTNALHLLGVNEQAVNKLDMAARTFDKVLVIDPEHMGAHYSKALLQASAGNHADALKHHDAAIRVAPSHFWALVNRGNSRAALKDFNAAIVDYDRALKLKPGLPEALTNKGNALTELNEYVMALACHEQAIKLRPGYPEAWANKSSVLVKLERLEEALDCADHALRIQPRHPQAWLNKGVALKELGRSEEALANFEQALALKADYAEAWSSQGAALDELERHEEALASLEKAIQWKPDYTGAWFNKGLALKNLGQDKEALACYDKALELEPDDPNANWNKGVLLIKLENYLEGWNKFGYRWHIKDHAVKLVTTRPEWHGDQSRNNLLIWGEQGVGDQVLFGGVLPDISKFPQRKWVALDKRLIPLFQRSMPGFEFLDIQQVRDELDYAEQIAFGSLPQYFRTTRENFTAARSPFLVADTTRAGALRQEIGRNGKLTCGVSWSSKRKGIGKNKSINLEQMLAPLASDRLHFVNLQYGDTGAERQALQEKHGIDVQNIDSIDNFNDLDGLAALIEACDIIITTSNTTAHLAGSLGKETLLLLPFGKGKLWYWQASQDGKSLWYPSIRMFSQEQPGAWQRPLAHIKSYLDQKQWN